MTGLDFGSMDYNGIGYSNIRLPNSSNNYIYIYDSRINEFPEEVYVHEFLHSLERTLIEYGYQIPALHDNKKYGYKEEWLIGLKNWYEAYMQCQIDDYNGNLIGLDSIVYTLKPVHESNFKYTSEIEFSKEADNIFEEIAGIVKSVGNTLKGN